MLSVGCNEPGLNGTAGTPCAGYQTMLEQRGQFALHVASFYHAFIFAVSCSVSAQKWLADVVFSTFFQWQCSLAFAALTSLFGNE
jgi:hypothetical protein